MMTKHPIYHKASSGLSTSLAVVIPANCECLLTSKQRARSGVLGRADLLSLTYLVVGGALLGLTTNLAKVAGEIGLAPLPFLAFSISGAAALLGVSAFLRGRLPPMRLSIARYCLVAALVSIAIPHLLFTSAVPHVGAGFVSLAVAFPPLLTYLGALVLGLERLDAARATGVGLALAGAAVVAVPKLAESQSTTIWVVATLLGPVFLALGNLYRSWRWPVGVAPDALAPGMLVATAVLLFGVGQLPGWSLEVPLDTAAPALLIVAQTLVFAIQYLMVFALQKRAGPIYMSFLGSVGVIVAVPIAVLFMGETLPTGLPIAAVLIASGIALVTGVGWSGRSGVDSQIPNESGDASGSVGGQGENRRDHRPTRTPGRP